MTAEELVDELAWTMYRAVNRPRSTRWEELADPLRDAWRDGAREALVWVHEHTRDVDARLPGQLTIDELLG